jgi:hypothetical protein
VLSTRCVDRAVPLVGQIEDGNASAKRVHTTIWSDMATCMAHHGVAPGAYLYVADAALVTEEHLAAGGDTLFISRLPATDTACGRGIQEAMAQDAWEEVGGLAHTKPTPNRPSTFSKVSEGEVPLYGTTSRAVVVPSSAQDTRRLKRLDREVQASYPTLQTAGRAAAKPVYVCRADAEAAAEKLRAMPTDSHLVDVVVEERPQDGKGRPSRHKPREVKAMRYGLRVTVRACTASLVRKRDEAGCFVLLTTVPTTGDLAHRASDVLQA